MDPQVHVELENFPKEGDVLPVQHDVHVHHALPQEVLQSGQGLNEGPGDPGQQIVERGGVAVHREGGLIEPRSDGPGCEASVGEHTSVGDRLNPAIAGLTAQPHERQEVGMDRRLSAAEDQARGALLDPGQDPTLDILEGHHGAVLRVGVKTEGAAVVAKLREADPLPLLLRRGLLDFEGVCHGP